MTQTAQNPRISFGSRVRKSPFFNATRRWGCHSYTIYNHTYLPTSYSDPATEYAALVNAVTLWDVACERQVQVQGPDAARFVQWLSPRDLSAMVVGQARYVPLLAEDGGIINDPVILKIADDCFWYSLADSDVLLWARGVALGQDYDVDITEPDVSPLQLQGPLASRVACDLFGDWVMDLKYFWFRAFDFEGIPLLLSRTGWSNERGYEIFLRDGRHGDTLWERIMSAGEPYGITPACPNQIKRMEAGLLSYNNDMDLSNNPFEVGLDRFVDLDGDFDFIGKHALEKIVEAGARRKMLGARIAGDPLAVNEHRWRILSGGEAVGEVTSACYSPHLESNIAFALLPAELAQPGSVVKVETPAGEREAELCELPFTQNRAR
jgi:aminomethyltransferase